MTKAWDYVKSVRHCKYCGKRIPFLSEKVWYCNTTHQKEYLKERRKEKTKT